MLSDLSGGGIERSCLTLVKALAERGWRLDLVLLKFAGNYRSTIPDGIPIYRLHAQPASAGLLEYCRDRGLEVRALRIPPGRMLSARMRLRIACRGLEFRDHERRFAPFLAGYVRAARPRLLFAAGVAANNAAVLATRILGPSIPTVASIHTNVRCGSGYAGRRKAVAERLMPMASAVVAVSEGAGAAAAAHLGLDRQRLHIIPNPVPMDEIRCLSRAELTHAWFRDGEPPVVLCVLREGAHKDWETLVRAFAQVHRAAPARLVILCRTTSTAYRAQIEHLAEDLGVGEDVEVLGFDENPFRYMRRAGVFVLSSRFEGLSNVLLEAMACGTPVVSSDAPFGPAEILDNGRCGKLVPVGDATALAEAITATLLDPVAGASGEAIRARLADFSLDRSAAAYDALFRGLLDGGAGQRP